MEIKNITDSKYTLDGKFTFTSNTGKIKMNAVDALEIAYALFDWAGMSYTILDEINEKLEERKND